MEAQAAKLKVLLVVALKRKLGDSIEAERGGVQVIHGGARREEREPGFCVERCLLCKIGGGGVCVIVAAKPQQCGDLKRAGA